MGETVFSVRYAMRLKKDLIIDNIIQPNTTVRIKLMLVYSKNK
jgi:hypothetical protein